MTGVLNAAVGAGGGERYTVTIGNVSDNYGFNDSQPYGSISSSSFRGVTIKVVSEDLGDNVFTVTLSGVQVQSLFGGIEIQSTAGTIAMFHTPSASFSTITNSSWQWTTSSDIWTSTSPSERLIRIF